MKRSLFLLSSVLLASLAGAMERQWTIGGGQWTIESTPLLVDWNHDRAPEILALNRAGQVLHWSKEGKPLGSGQDGTICRLPEGLWTSTPLYLGADDGPAIVLCSVEGLVVFVDETFSVKWQFQLDNKTAWGKATPALLNTSAGMQFLLGDEQGVLTCLDLHGQMVWRRSLAKGACHAPLLVRQDSILAASGRTLFCLDATGQEVWQKELVSELTSMPMECPVAGRPLLICGSKDGTVTALGMDGRIAWQSSIHDEVNSYMALLPQQDKAPLIVCSGLWGSVHAFDGQGHRLWYHTFRSKNRSAPVPFDVNGDGDLELLLSAYNQHLYAFDKNGYLVDDVRLAGQLIGSPLPLYDEQVKRTDAIVASWNLLAFRLKPGAPISPYGAPALAGPVSVRFSETGARISNPTGSLLRVNLFSRNDLNCASLRGCVTARSEFEIDWPAGMHRHDRATVVITDALGKPQLREGFKPASRAIVQPGAPHLQLWSVSAYATFDPCRLTPDAGLDTATTREMRIPCLYRGEIDQAACVIASTLPEPATVQLAISTLTTAEGKPFTGTITLRQVIATGSFNGEMIADALPKLAEDQIVTVPAQRAIKIWLSVDSRTAEPGCYRGELSITPPAVQGPALTMPMYVEILKWQLDRQTYLPVCTWDYVPNKWFSDAGPALDDMNRHGVTIFPRTVSPTAAVDSLGALKMNWQAVDIELERLKGRGQILFQIGHPAITFSRPPDEQTKRRFEIEFLRAFRDHLTAQGINYNDYAFYPLDEPGLDYGKNIPVLLDAAQLFREADARLRVYTDPVPGLSWQDFQRIEPFIDVWCPNMRLVSGLLAADPRIERIIKSGKPVWSYECVSQTKSLSPLRYNRANAWRAKFFGLDGIGFWTHSTQPFNPWFTPMNLNDEYALVYPGEAPVPSVRWEAVRDGVEDMAALALLQQQIERGRNTSSQRDLIKRAQEVVRIALVDVMELSDAAFIESRDYLQQGDRMIWHSPADVELYQRHRQAIAELSRQLDH